MVRFTFFLLFYFAEIFGLGNFIVLLLYATFFFDFGIVLAMFNPYLVFFLPIIVIPFLYPTFFLFGRGFDLINFIYLIIMYALCR